MSIQKRLEAIKLKNIVAIYYKTKENIILEPYKEDIGWLISLAIRQAEVIAKQDEFILWCSLCEQVTPPPSIEKIAWEAREVWEESRKLLEEDLE